jgi:hypothetical protein
MTTSATADPTMLIEQLAAVIKDPTPYAQQSSELIYMARKAAVALEGPFESLQRLAYAV